MNGSIRKQVTPFGCDIFVKSDMSGLKKTA